MRVCERVFSAGFGPGLDSMSPARSMMADFPKKLGGRRDGVGGCNLHSPPDCGTPTTSRLYPFGASLSVMDIFSVNLKFFHIRFYTL